jgi:hypothetical protein
MHFAGKPPAFSHFAKNLLQSQRAAGIYLKLVPSTGLSCFYVVEFLEVSGRRGRFAHFSKCGNGKKFTAMCEAFR